MTEGSGDPSEDVTVTGANATPAPEPPDPPAGVGGVSSAPDDQEMPLADHIEEMVKRLGVVVVVMAAVSAVALPFADELINFLWYSFLPGETGACLGGVESGSAACPRVYHPLALVLARLKVSSLAGFVIALPVFVYETYLFMRPGLYPNERRYYLASVPTSLILAGVGIAFAYFLVLPVIFTYFLGYSQPVADVAFGLSDTFTLILLMLGMFAFIFQIPLFVMLAIMMGVTSRRWLESRRLYFWAGFAGVAFIFSPDPTGMAPFIVAVTMVALFEGTLALLRWSGEGSMAPGPTQIAGLRPLVWLLTLAAGYVASPAPIPSGYYDDLPAVVRETLASAGLTGATPVLVGLGILVGFELLGMLLVRFGGARGPRRWLWQAKRVQSYLRVPVWLGTVVVAYLASPQTPLVQRAEAPMLTMVEAAVAVAAVLVVYEGGLFLWRWRRGELRE
ncbi:twin-arginine translocase subunit TatC [Halobacteriales archaeon Cl-PHB]